MNLLEEAMTVECVGIELCSLSIEMLLRIENLRQ
jgi:hypothetical protein